MDGRDTNLMTREGGPGRPERIAGCLLGGAVGDALGAPVEFLRLSEIRETFGPALLTDFSPAYGRLGAITDDTQMTLFTAEGLLRAVVPRGAQGDLRPRQRAPPRLPALAEDAGARVGQRAIRLRHAGPPGRRPCRHLAERLAPLRPGAACAARPREHVPRRAHVGGVRPHERAADQQFEGLRRRDARGAGGDRRGRRRSRVRAGLPGGRHHARAPDGLARRRGARRDRARGAGRPERRARPWPRRCGCSRRTRALSSAARR